MAALRDRVGGLGRVRQRRAEHHQHLVLENQLLEDVDRLLFLALLVFDLQHDLVAVDAACGIDLVGRQLEAVRIDWPYWPAGPGQRLGGADLEIGGCCRSHETDSGHGADPVPCRT